MERSELRGGAHAVERRRVDGVGAGAVLVGDLTGRVCVLFRGW